MISFFRFLPFLCATLAITSHSCATTSTKRVDVPLSLRGTALPTSIEGRNGAMITIERADLAFGPLYLCSGPTAGDLCDVARVEWLDTAVINTLDANAQFVGNLVGTAGQVRSWMFDLAISSQLTQDNPVELDAAAALGSNSAVVEGEATIGGNTIRFVAEVRIEQLSDAEFGVPVIRSSVDSQLNHEIAEGDMLTIAFDSTDWVAAIDFEQLINDQCGEESCPDPIVISVGSQAYNAIHNGISSGKRPTFTWSTAVSSPFSHSNPTHTP